MNRSRDHDATGQGFCFQPRSNVHAVAVEVGTIDDQVAKVEADAEDDSDIFGVAMIGLGHSLLELDRRA